MKLIWYHIVKNYIRIGFAFYFKKISIHNPENIPKNKAVIFVANHQNALIDPILIGATNPREIYYLTRSNVFKNPIIKIILTSINMLPIFRMRDGFETLSKNEAIFQKCFKILNQNKSILIFPEGNHNIHRRVRILSKGFTRIVFGAIEQNPSNNIVIVPIGLNYSNPTKYATNVSLYYGKPISANYYWGKFDKNDSVIHLKNEVREQLKLLTTHIEDLNRYEEISKHFTPDEFLFPEIVNQKIKTLTNFSVAKSTRNNDFNVLEFIVKLNSFFPLLIWKNNSSKIIEKEFISTFKFVLGITAFPIFYVLQAFLISQFWSFQIGVSYLLLSILCVYILTKTQK